MRRFTLALREVFGLFVDDGSFALAILVWSVVACLVLPRIDVGHDWNGVILFAGLAAILVESAWRRAGR